MPRTLKESYVPPENQANCIKTTCLSVLRKGHNDQEQGFQTSSGPVCSRRQHNLTIYIYIYIYMYVYI